MSKVLLAIDMDDTLTDTQEEVVLRLRHKLYDTAAWDDLKWVYDAVHANRKNGLHSTMLYPEHLRKIITRDIIREGSYVKTVKPTKLITDGEFLNMLYRLKDILADDLTIIIATHRNAESGVQENTHDWLDRYDISRHLNGVHFIHGGKHSNKIDYLKSLFPEHEILLLDDNPFGDLHTVHAPNESVLVYQELCNYEAYKHQNKFSSVNALGNMIMDLAGRDDNAK